MMDFVLIQPYRMSKNEAERATEKKSLGLLEIDKMFLTVCKNCSKNELRLGDSMTFVYKYLYSMLRIPSAVYTQFKNIRRLKILTLTK